MYDYTTVLNSVKKNLFQTRWVDRHDGVTVFKKLLFPVIDALNEMKHWNTAKGAVPLLNNVDFKFLVSLQYVSLREFYGKL